MNGTLSAVVHLAPRDGAAMACCGQAPFEVPSWHRITTDTAQVTCPGKEES